jgi:putative spermidine/putrescine transport system ATP-binding protein
VNSSTPARSRTASSDILGSRHGGVLLQQISHTFENGFTALAPTDLQVESGTFTTLLGPSGSGKTTLLRIISGLITPTTGSVTISGRDVTDVAIQDRNIGFVFQHHTLFPHMTVADNLGFPLQMRKIGKSERARRVTNALDLVRLTHLRKRRPGQLTGVQQQRVAIARALVYSPDVVLLDEPLGSLDRRLRQHLGAELRKIQQETGITAVYVTHDQEEAFLLSDLIVVMDEGHIRQKGDPEEVYSAPKDVFVAGFLGDTNFFIGRAETSVTPHNTVSVDVYGQSLRVWTSHAVTAGQNVTCTIRPEDVQIIASGATPPSDNVAFGAATIAARYFLGSIYRLNVAMEGMDLTLDVECSRGSYAPPVGSPVAVTLAKRSVTLTPRLDRFTQSSTP